MSGFILNRGKSFAARYKEYESKPEKKISGDVKGSSSSESVDVISCKPVRKVFDEHEDEIVIDYELSRTGPKLIGIGGSEVKSTKGKRNKKKEKPPAKSSKRSTRNVVIPKYEDFDSDLDIIDDNHSSKSDSDASNFSDADSIGPDLDITVIDTDQPNPFKERRTETITLKVKFNGQFNKFKVDYNDRILKHISVFYKTLGVTKKTHELIITYNDKALEFSDTPKSLDLTIVDILEAYAKERTEPQERSSKAKVHRNSNSLEIKVRNNQDGRHDQPLSIYLDKNGTMRSLMEQYAEAKKYNLSDLIFEFDGERLSGEETPTDLDMETGSLIDVRIKSK